MGLFDDSSASILAVMATIADGLLMNAPSSALMDDIQREYNISLAKARQLYNQLSRIRAQSESELNDIANKRISLENLVGMYPAMGMITESIRNELKAIRANESSAKQKLKQAEADEDAAEQDLVKKEYEIPTPKNAVEQFLKTL